MSEPDFLSNSRIAILGIGLMGGSLAMALRGRCRELLGCDPDRETLSQAEKLELFNHLSTDPAEILPAADVIVLATPLREVLSLLGELPILHPGSAIVLDLGSTKSQVCQAMKGLPDRFDPLGGHPMCGKEKIGLENAEAGLFEDATFAFTALEGTSSKARSFAEQLALSIGARHLWIDADTHDQWSAAISHMPYLIAAALSAATPIETAQLVGPGFRSTTRIAATPASIMLDVVKTNRNNILASLTGFRAEIDQLEKLILKEDFVALNLQLVQSAEHHSLLMHSSVGKIK